MDFGFLSYKHVVFLFTLRVCKRLRQGSHFIDDVNFSTAQICPAFWWRHKEGKVRSLLDETDARPAEKTLFCEIPSWRVGKALLILGYLLYLLIWGIVKIDTDNTRRLVLTSNTDNGCKKHGGKFPSRNPGHFLFKEEISKDSCWIQSASRDVLVRILVGSKQQHRSLFYSHLYLSEQKQTKTEKMAPWCWG